MLKSKDLGPKSKQWHRWFLTLLNAAGAVYRYVAKKSSKKGVLKFTLPAERENPKSAGWCELFWSTFLPEPKK